MSEILSDLGISGKLRYLHNTLFLPSLYSYTEKRSVPSLESWTLLMTSFSVNSKRSF